MTVFVYVNTSKQVGDAEHVKVFATTDAAETWFEENDKAWPLNTRFWNEPVGRRTSYAMLAILLLAII
jgi:hypothetical protein